MGVYGLRGGHSPNCKGAMGLRDEYACMQELYKYVRDILIRYGHTVIDCNSNGSTANAELSEGARKANNANVDLFISLHMNACDGQAHGTEAWTYGANSSANTVAKRLVDNFSSLGFTNRGVKYNPNYYEMKYVNAPNIIFESLFCDSEIDINIWSPTSYEKMARLIANAIDPNIPITEDTVNYTHYAVEQINIVDSNENVTGALWKDEQFQLRWVTDDYRIYVRYWNSNKTAIKEGLIEKGKESLILRIREVPSAPEKTYLLNAEKEFKDSNEVKTVKEKLELIGFRCSIK